MEQHSSDRNFRFEKAGSNRIESIDNTVDVGPVTIGKLTSRRELAIQYGYSYAQVRRAERHLQMPPSRRGGKVTYDEDQARSLLAILERAQEGPEALGEGGDGELEARIFRLLREGRTGAEVVEQLAIPSVAVLRARDHYRQLSESILLSPDDGAKIAAVTGQPVVSGADVVRVIGQLVLKVAEAAEKAKRAPQVAISNAIPRAWTTPVDDLVAEIDTANAGAARSGAPAVPRAMNPGRKGAP